MGGLGSGGHNRTHGTVEHHNRADSFRFNMFLMGDKYLHYHETVVYPLGRAAAIVYHVQDKRAELHTSRRCRPLWLSEVPGINGKGFRLFFLCPGCGRRVRYLYQGEEYVCRHCLKINYTSQQQTDDRQALRRKMRRIVEKDLGYCGWKRMYPGCGIENLPELPRPRYMHRSRYAELIGRYRQLQEKYREAEIYDLMPYWPKNWINRTEETDNE